MMAIGPLVRAVREPQAGPVRTTEEERPVVLIWSALLAELALALIAAAALNRWVRRPRRDERDGAPRVAPPCRAR